MLVVWSDPTRKLVTNHTSVGKNFVYNLIHRNIYIYNTTSNYSAKHYVS